MDIVYVILELLKIVVPTVVVAGGMYLVVKQYLDRDYKRKLLELRINNSKTIVPMRLQAYERVLLLLERITPSNLLLRVSGSAVTAQEYHRMLLNEIRSEFEHNVTQQMYMTEQAWLQVKRSKEDVVTLINRCSHQMTEKSKGTELAKRVLETIITEEMDPTANAITFVKREIQTLF